MDSIVSKMTPYITRISSVLLGWKAALVLREVSNCRAVDIKIVI